MPLLAYNLTGFQVTLVAGNPAPILPASPNPPARGPAVDVTNELQGLGFVDYDALETQHAGTVDFEWTGSPEFPLGTLTATAVGEPGAHAATHAPGGADALIHAATHLSGGGDSLTVGNATATETLATTGVSLSLIQVVAQPMVISGHETFLTPVATGTVLGTIDETVASVNASLQPGHPFRLGVTFDAGWEGGDIRIDGLGADGQVLTETVPSFPGSTLGTNNAFLSIDPSGIVNLAPAGGGGDVVTVVVSNQLGIAFPKTSGYILTAFTRLAVDGVQEAIFGGSLSQKTFGPTSSPFNGARSYEIWYTGTYTPTHDLHNHAVSDSGHTHVHDPHTHLLT